MTTTVVIVIALIAFIIQHKVERHAQKHIEEIADEKSEALSKAISHCEEVIAIAKVSQLQLFAYFEMLGVSTDDPMELLEGVKNLRHQLGIADDELMGGERYEAWFEQATKHHLIKEA